MSTTTIEVYGEITEFTVSHEGGDPCGLTNVDESTVSEETLFDIDVPDELLEDEDSLREFLMKKIQEAEIEGYSYYRGSYHDKHGHPTIISIF